ncbi:MAG: sulfotransferase family protein [Spiribacter salinus]|uniref:Sulfotransferase family protein n=1 Tax=Spiribacter salinus TaxID=1335746 RepID=A0A540VNU3_9GAMM|nr:MAG: sulfotransferase family protein [Spiribacter salinus]
MLRKVKNYIRARYGFGRVQEIKNPCESIDLDRMIMFIAIPKTGSSSIRSYTRGEGAYLVPQEHLNFQESRDALMAYLIRSNLGGNWAFPSHEVPTYDDLVALRAEKIRHLIKFSVVRNPWARAVSLYFRSEGIKPSRTMSFDDFVERMTYASDTCVNPSKHQNQFDWIVDRDGKIAVDFVEKLEGLGQRRGELNEKLQGRCRVGDAKLNVNPASKSERYREIYSDRSRKRIASLFEKDIDYFGYTF